MEINKNELHKFETKNCAICKIIEGHLSEMKIPVHHHVIPDDEDAFKFVKSITPETSMPILAMKTDDGYKTLSGLHSEKEVRDFVMANNQL